MRCIASDPWEHSLLYLFCGDEAPALREMLAHLPGCRPKRPPSPVFERVARPWLRSPFAPRRLGPRACQGVLFRREGSSFDTNWKKLNVWHGNCCFLSVKE